MSYDARLQRLIDSSEIRELAQRYAIAITSRDLDAVVELFDPGVDSGKWGTGRDGIRAYYADFFAQSERHVFFQVGTHQVDLIDDTTATGVCLTRTWDIGPGNIRMDGMVAYFDTYRRRDERWAFVQRRETMHDALISSHEESKAPRGLPRTWEYWDRWRERKASGKLFER
jgi:uncharacterized protein (TIGR02246 family)